MEKHGHNKELQRTKAVGSAYSFKYSIKKFDCIAIFLISSKQPKLTLYRKIDD